MDYDQTEEYLYSLPRMGWEDGQKRIQELLDKWSNPERELRCIQVAGTNGKGSVVTMISSILRANNFRVGKYVSPHLDRLTERVQVNDQDIPKEELAQLVSEANELGHDCTFFELMTAVALKYFEGKTDYCVLEVGLGGRLDATSVVHPLVCVITNIDLEHTHILGNTLGQIAAEKAGMIKNGCTVITAEKKPEALGIISLKCEEENAELIRVEKGEYDLAMRGDFQQWNAACAVEAVKALEDELDPMLGLSEAVISGRMEKQDNVLMDVAHNPAGMRVLRGVLEKIDYERLFVVFGAKKNKNVEEMLLALPPMQELVITEYANAPGPMRASVILEAAKELDPKGNFSVIREVEEAMYYAKRAARADDLIVVTGSTFVVSEAREFLKHL